MVLLLHQILKDSHTLQFPKSYSQCVSVNCPGTMYSYMTKLQLKKISHIIDNHSLNMDIPHVRTMPGSLKDKADLKILFDKK